MAAGLDLDALMPPEIDGDIKSIQVELGAIFNDEGIATTFKNKQNALNALEAGVALVDRSHWGRLRISGADRASFLHNQSTNDFRSLAPRTGCDTVFVTSTARCIDLATVLVMESSLLVITSPTMKDAMLQRFDKYIFPGDKVVVQDVSYNTAMLSLLGPESDNILRELAGDAITVIGQPYGSHQILNFQGRGPVIIMAGTELRGAGYTLIADEAVAGDVYSLLASKGCIPLGEEDWDAARILAGRPMPGSELTQDYLPLDAGLFHAVSVNKGCYIGQETLVKVARLNAVKQQLWGLRLSAPAEPGAPITSELSRVGTLTSAAQDAAGEWVGLGYFRKTPGTQLQLDGVAVSVNGDVARVAALPYSTWAFRDGAAPPAVAGSSTAGSASEGSHDGGSLEDRAQKAKQEKAEAQAAATAAKEERLKALQAQLDAWQAQQAAAKKQTDKAGSGST